MSSSKAPRCRHIKVSGIQCGSPALRSKNFCFYHEHHRPISAECYEEGKYSTGEIVLPALKMRTPSSPSFARPCRLLLQKRIERKTASLLLYALQIASSNLKRMELEKPQPEQVVIDVVKQEDWQSPIAVADKEEKEEKEEQEASANEQPDTERNNESEGRTIDEELPPGTIQAQCADEDQLLDYKRPWNRNPTLAQKTRKNGAPRRPSLQSVKRRGPSTAPGQSLRA